MSSSLVDVELLDSGVAIVAFNRPEALNTMTLELLREATSALLKLSTDPSIRAVVLTGRGRAFTAGVDFTRAHELFFNGEAPPGTDLIGTITNMPVPVIAAVNGHAFTGGLEIMLACDMRIASNKAKFADTHSKFGVMPCWGLSQRLQLLIGRGRARYMHFTARSVDAVTAEKWGLVDILTEPENVLTEAIATATSIAKNQDHVVRKIKSVMDKGECLPIDQGLKLEYDVALKYYKTMDRNTFANMNRMVSGTKSRL